MKFNIGAFILIIGLAAAVAVALGFLIIGTPAGSAGTGDVDEDGVTYDIQVGTTLGYYPLNVIGNRWDMTSFTSKVTKHEGSPFNLMWLGIGETGEMTLTASLFKSEEKIASQTVSCGKFENLQSVNTCAKQVTFTDNDAGIYKVVWTAKEEGEIRYAETQQVNVP